MKKFELDTTYEDGLLTVVARTDSRVIFIEYGTVFLIGEIFLKDGTECTEIHDRIIKADNGAGYSSVSEKNIKTLLEIAQGNLEYVKREENDEELIDELKKVIWLLEKRLFDKQLNSCPECGGEVKFVTGGMGFFFKCSKCGHRWHGGILVNGEERRMQKIEQAIERWNSRKEVA